MTDTSHLWIPVVGAAVALYGAGKMWRAFRLSFRGHTATGEIVQTRFRPWHRYDSDAVAHLHIQFETPQATVKFKEVMTGPIFRRLTQAIVDDRLGRPVKVTYDPRKPQRASTNVPRDLRSGGLYLAFGLIFLGAFLIYGDQVDDISWTPPYEIIQSFFD